MGGRTGSHRGGVRVEKAALAAGGHRHPDGRRGPAQRAGGDLDAGGVVVPRGGRGSWSPRCAATRGRSSSQAVARQVQLDVLGEAGVPGGQHEAVAAEPVRVARVVPHHPLEQRVGQRRQAHRGARVAVADLLHRVGGEHPDRVDGPRSRSVQSTGSSGQGEQSGCRLLAAGARWVAAVAKPGGQVGAEGAGPSSLSRDCSGPGVVRHPRRAGGARLSRPTEHARSGACARTDRRSAAQTGAAVVRRLSGDRTLGWDVVGQPADGIPAGRTTLSRLRRTDQATDHRAAAGHHDPGDVPRRAAACRRRGWWSRRWSAARWPLPRQRAELRTLDADIDAVMHRTERRPLAPAPSLPRRPWSSGSCWACCRRSGWRLTTTLAAASIRGRDPVLRLVYTMLLKRRTSQNIVWGGTPAACRC